MQAGGAATKDWQRSILEYWAQRPQRQEYRVQVRATGAQGAGQGGNGELNTGINTQFTHFLVSSLFNLSGV